MEMALPPTLATYIYNISEKWYNKICLIYGLKQVIQALPNGEKL
jgi:hypothetical protein